MYTHKEDKEKTMVEEETKMVYFKFKSYLIKLFIFILYQFRSFHVT